MDNVEKNIDYKSMWEELKRMAKEESHELNETIDKLSDEEPFGDIKHAKSYFIGLYSRTYGMIRWMQYLEARAERGDYPAIKQEEKEAYVIYHAQYTEIDYRQGRTIGLSGLRVVNESFAYLTQSEAEDLDKKLNASCTYSTELYIIKKVSDKSALPCSKTFSK